MNRTIAGALLPLLMAACIPPGPSLRSAKAPPINGAAEAAAVHRLALIAITNEALPIELNDPIAGVILTDWIPSGDKDDPRLFAIRVTTNGGAFTVEALCRSHWDVCGHGISHPDAVGAQRRIAKGIDAGLELEPMPTTQTGAADSSNVCFDDADKRRCFSSAEACAGARATAADARTECAPE